MDFTQTLKKVEWKTVESFIQLKCLLHTSSGPVWILQGAQKQVFYGFRFVWYIQIVDTT